ncbi:hypothetical protein BDV18DRAFT_145556 [Aspergillus unguis]
MKSLKRGRRREGHDILSSCARYSSGLLMNDYSSVLAILSCSHGVGDRLRAQRRSKEDELYSVDSQKIGINVQIEFTVELLLARSAPQCWVDDQCV